MMTFCSWVRTSQNQLLIIGSLWAPLPPTPNSPYPSPKINCYGCG
jgi:hypothetical protein